jgi:hypothetical protein
MRITSTDWMIVTHVYMAAGLASGHGMLTAVAFGFLAITVYAYLREEAAERP